MEITLALIEDLTAEMLRHLPVCEEDIYEIEQIERLEEGDEISAAEGGFMRGYLEGNYS
jgi:hypothetical protein